MDDRSLLDALTPEAERLVERHLSTTKEWFPHELTPWERGAELKDARGDWQPEVAVDPAVRSAVFVNLLTEDNLPYYFRDIERMFGRDGVWGEWNRRWTAEEGRHSIVLRDYITLARLFDPVELERGRMAQVSLGEVPEPPSAADGIVYVALQELATRISHRNTGKLLDDPAGYQVMARVGADENLHYLFYRDLVTAALEVDPSTVVLAIERQVREFEMPGTGIPDFTDHAKRIAKAGIYDFSSHHDQILQPVVLRHWALEEVEGLSPEAEDARSACVDRIAKIGKAAARQAARRAEREAAADREPDLVAAG
jgi:acyl-[acyl-carrier-protein] desaturase